MKFVGVSWKKQRRKWRARIHHYGKKQHLGYFNGEQEAARVVDTAARRLRGEDAHGGRVGNDLLRLNAFPLLLLLFISAASSQVRTAVDRVRASAARVSALRLRKLV